MNIATTFGGSRQWGGRSPNTDTHRPVIHDTSLSRQQAPRTLPPLPSTPERSPLSVTGGRVFDEGDGHGGQHPGGHQNERKPAGGVSRGRSRTTTRDDVATNTQDCSEELLLRFGFGPGRVGMTVVSRGIKDEDHLNHLLRAMCRGSVRVDISLMALRSFGGAPGRSRPALQTFLWFDTKRRLGCDERASSSLMIDVVSPPGHRARVGKQHSGGSLPVALRGRAEGQQVP